MSDTRYVTVCSECLRATCWQGMFMCDKAYGAGTFDLDVEYLKVRALENPCYWENDEAPDEGAGDAVDDSEVIGRGDHFDSISRAIASGAVRVRTRRPHGSADDIAEALPIPDSNKLAHLEFAYAIADDFGLVPDDDPYGLTSRIEALHAKERARIVKAVTAALRDADAVNHEDAAKAVTDKFIVKIRFPQIRRITYEELVDRTKADQLSLRWSGTAENLVRQFIITEKESGSV